MTFRIEEKLYIRSDNLIDFRSYLNSKSVKQMYHPRKIKSLYFDNSNLAMYNDSIEGTVPRKKIRIRDYPGDEDKQLYLEIKNSSAEGRFKSRKIISDKLFDQYKNDGILDSQYGVCFPNFYVNYKREYSIVDDVRISIDTNILYEDYKTHLTYNDNKIIVEIKTSIKKDLDDLIELFPFQRIRFSKYCFAVDTLNQRNI
jgi:SPX domain protein involved in polyphosphate accumulation